MNNMENKECKEAEEKQEIRMMTLSSSFSNHRYIFYHCLRAVNSIIISSTALWYSHYYLIRTDDDKSYSYFCKKPKLKPPAPTPTPTCTQQRKLCDKITQFSLLFCVATNLLSKLKKRALTKLLINIKSSHFKSHAHAIYVKQSDLQLLNKWKCLLGGHKYYFGSLDTSILVMLYTSLISETTLFAFNKQAALSLTAPSDSDPSQSDWKNRYFQFEQETQEIEWLNTTQSQPQISDKPSLYSSTYAVVTQYIALFSVPSFVLSYSFFPISTLCALNVFKCGMSVEHRQECNTLVWWNKRLCFVAIAKHIFMAIINKLHYLRYFAIREVSIATYKKNINPGNKSKKKKNSKNKLERRLKNLLALRSFTYDIVNIFPWFCVYFSCVATQSATYYIKTFASQTWFYSSLSKAKHNKNKYLLKIASVSTLLIGVCVAVGNETYFESVKYAKKWFLSVDQYSIESYQSEKKAKEIMEQDAYDLDDKSHALTPGKEKDATYQIEGGEGYKITPKYSALQEKLINGNYQQDSEMLLSKRYFHQKAHDLFEYMTEICVFLEDKFLNALIVPVY